MTTTLSLATRTLARLKQLVPNISEFSPGDYVVATVRRPGSSIYDLIGSYDMTTDDVYRERGINLLHGYLTEYYVDDATYLVKVPDALREVGVVVEPLSVAEKGINQAYEIQRRLKVWQPQRAAVFGVGTIGLLAALVLRLRGLDVTAFGRTKGPNRNASLINAIGARYVSTSELSLKDATAKHGPFDIIYEATGHSPMAFEGMEVLGKNGVLILASVTGGDRTAEVATDRINLDIVLGNKVIVGTVSGNLDDFSAAVHDLAVAQTRFPGWIAQLLTHRIDGLENYRQLFDTLTNAHDAIKIVMDIAPLEESRESRNPSPGTR